MPSSFSWLFNNPHRADFTLVIASHNHPSGSLVDSVSQVTHSEQTADAGSTRTLYAHSLVLETYSDFFRARHADRWQNCSNQLNESHQQSRRKRTREPDEEPTITICVESDEDIPLAEAMIQFMYTEDLQERNVLELLKLMQLADQYGVLSLISRCASLAYDSDFDSWSLEDNLAAIQLPDSLLSHESIHRLVSSLKAHLLLSQNFKQLQATAGCPGAKGVLANQLLECLLSQYHDLHAVWNDDKQRQQFLELPLNVVDAVLSSDDLLLPSENMVLVAAIDWIGGPVGRQLPAVKQQEIAARVRFPQLRPWFIAELLDIIAFQRNDISWMPDNLVAQLGYYLSADAKGKEACCRRPGCEAWGRPRRHAEARASFEVKAKANDIKASASYGDVELSYFRSHSSQSLYVDGMLCTPQLVLCSGSAYRIASLQVVVRPKLLSIPTPNAWYRSCCDQFSFEQVLQFEGVDGVCQEATCTSLKCSVSLLGDVELNNLLPRLSANLKEDGTIGPLKVQYMIP